MEHGLSPEQAKSMDSDTPEVIDATDRDDDEEFSDHSAKEEEKGEKVEEKSRAQYLWGVAAIAGTFIGANLVGRMLGGSPVDEDDAIAVVAIIKGGGGAGAGGGGGAGGASSAQ